MGHRRWFVVVIEPTSHFGRPIHGKEPAYIKVLRMGGVAWITYELIVKQF